MAVGLDPDSGLFEQFSGYFGLEDVDLSAYGADPSRSTSCSAGNGPSGPR